MKNEKVVLAFISLVVITLSLTLLMGPLSFLREKTETYNFLGMIGVAGVYAFLFSPKKSLWQIPLTSVSIAASITYIDQIMGFTPGLYPITMFFLSLSCVFGLSAVWGKNTVNCFLFSIAGGWLLFLLLFRISPWWLWYVDSYIPYMLPIYFTVIMVPILLTKRFKKSTL